MLAIFLSLPSPSNQIFPYLLIPVIVSEECQSSLYLLHWFFISIQEPKNELYFYSQLGTSQSTMVLVLLHASSVSQSITLKLNYQYLHT